MNAGYPQGVRTALPLLAALALPSIAGAKDYPKEDTLLGREMVLRGFHFQVSFGIGGGPDTVGLFHSMEIGGTLGNGLTIAMLHTFIQNKGMFGTTKGGPDLIGGWMLEAKYPIVYPEIVAKVAFGLGGIHDQSDGIKAHGGPGFAYGIDFSVPTFKDQGVTLTFQGMNVWGLGQHHFGAAAAIGYTAF